MKTIKFLIICTILFYLNIPAIADVMPLYTKAINKETIGFIQVPKSFKLYFTPNDSSQIIEKIKWNNTEVQYKNLSAEPYRLFVAQIKNLNYAFCAVIDEQDGWYKIIYDKQGNKSGWIKPEKQDDFWGLKDFYSYFGRRHGLYYMKNIDYRKRGIYSGADAMAQKIGGFTLIKSIKLNKISGNWALVTVTDLDAMPKIGYIQWREPDGSIIIFPKLDN